MMGTLAPVGVDRPGERRDRDDQAAERYRVDILRGPLWTIVAGEQGGLDLHARAGSEFRRQY
jgi:hypothetical protein